MSKAVFLGVASFLIISGISAQYKGAGFYKLESNKLVRLEPSTTGDLVIEQKKGGLIQLTATTKIDNAGASQFRWCKTQEGYWVTELGLKLTRLVTPTNDRSTETSLVDYDCSQPPPILVLENKSLTFEDANENGFIDANEAAKLSFIMRNEGPGPAKGLRVETIGANRSSQGAWVAEKTAPSEILPQQDGAFTVSVASDQSTKDGAITLQISVTDVCGHGASPFEVSLPTRAFQEPIIKVVDASSNPTRWKRGVPIELTILVQNVGLGIGEDVDIQLDLPEEVTCYSGNQVVSIPRLLSGESQEILYQIIIPTTFESTSLSTNVLLSEFHGKYSNNWTRIDSLGMMPTVSTFSLGATGRHQGEQVSESRISSKNEGYIEFNRNPKDVVVERVAVVAAQGMDCGGTLRSGQDLASYVEGSLLSNYEIVERRNLERVLDEQKLALSGIMFEKSTVEAGCNIGAQGIIFTEFGCIGGEETIQVKLVDCQTSELYWSATGHGSSILDVVKEIKRNLDGDEND